MKRFTTLFLIFVRSFSLAACNNSANQKDAPPGIEASKEESGGSTADNQTNASSDVLVVYFSATGTTQSLAE